MEPTHADKATRAPWLDDAAARVAGADASTLRGFMHGAVSYGGLWFADPKCREQFIVPRTIGEDELDAFAGCVAGLHLTVSERSYHLYDFAIFSYPPGLEVEARISGGPHGTQLLWIGYEGSAGELATLPTVTTTCGVIVFRLPSAGPALIARRARRYLKRIVR